MTGSLRGVSAFVAMTMDGLSVVGFLAQWGQDDTVKNFLNSPNFSEKAIYGYAMAGDTSNVNAIFESCSDASRERCMGMAVRGYARSGYFDCIYAMENHLDYLSDQLRGLAEGGQWETAARILDRNMNLFQYAVAGLAACNHAQTLLNVLVGTDFYPLAIYQAAYSGHVDLVNSLLACCGVPDDFRVITVNQSFLMVSRRELNSYYLLNHALSGYLEGRHFHAAAAVLGRGASIAQMVLELKNAHGLPDHDLYIAFLAHVSDQDVRNQIIQTINSQSGLENVLQISSDDIQQLEVVMGRMAEFHLNYLEACNRFEEKHPLSSGGVGLQFIADVLTNAVPHSREGF